MKLQEYQSKQLFAEQGIAVSRGLVSSTALEARQAAETLGGRVAVKAQVLVGGRGKAGGIKVASDPEMAEKYASEILAMTIKGYRVRKVLVELAADIETEIYLAVTNDRATCRTVIVASAAGGVDIEDVAMTEPEKIIQEIVNPFLGLREYQARRLASGIDLPVAARSEFVGIAMRLYKTFVECSASISEINPLVLTPRGRLVALDGKIVIDDNALFRHQDLADMRDADDESEAEHEARQHGLSYVALDGNIGCMVNGAGLAMGTMDIIKHFGGNPANFLDIGGGAGVDKVAAALRIILKEANVQALLINIFGGITRCDEVAQGVLEAMRDVQIKIPVVVRLAGTNEEEGRKLLAGADIIGAASLADGARKAVAAATASELSR